MKLMMDVGPWRPSYFLVWHIYVALWFGFFFFGILERRYWLFGISRALCVVHGEYRQHPCLAAIQDREEAIGIRHAHNVKLPKVK